MTTTIESRESSCRGRIVMVIANLEPGGTQRQLCLLATSLSRRGFSIRVVVFQPNTFFEHALQTLQIPIVHLRPRSRLHLILLLRRELRVSTPDVVIGFNHWANFLVELSGLPARTFSVIASERSLDVPPDLMSRRIRYRIKRRISYYFHRAADAIVSNSYAQGAIVGRTMRRSRTRTEVIVNGVDIDHFQPVAKTVNDCDHRLKLIILARIAPEKNVLRFIDAVRLVRAMNPGLQLEVYWYGDKPMFSARDARRRSAQYRLAYFHRVTDKLDRYGLRHWFHIRSAQRDVRELYLGADAMCLPSLVEGRSNVIAEAMACALPVLASRVGDNMSLVKDGHNGFLFDPLSVTDIARKIIRFSELSPSKRREHGQKGREMAESLLSADALAERYEHLVANLITERPFRR